MIFLISLNVKAQSDFSAVAEVNYNTFSHKEISDFQQELMEDIPEIDLRVNDDFGANIGYSLGLKVEDLDTQFFAAYNSTGGKISYGDYSGLIRITQLLKAYTAGAEYQFRLLDNDSKGVIYLGLRGLLNYTTLDLRSHSEIYDSVSSESVDFDAVDLGVGVAFNYDIPVWIVKLRLKLGYDLFLGGELKFSEDREVSLEDNEGDLVKTGWSGLRTGVGIVVPINF